VPNYREHYFPNTERLAADEMRVTALGTGRPFLRPAQANAGWLIELGNGDRFMFDFGFGTQMNFSALEIPYQDMTAYFATHLHTDHVGDFARCTRRTACALRASRRCIFTTAL
jgi:ribonuclease Z